MVKRSYRVISLNELREFTRPLTELIYNVNRDGRFSREEWLHGRRHIYFSEVRFDAHQEVPTNDSVVTIVFSDLSILPNPPFKNYNSTELISIFLNEMITITAGKIPPFFETARIHEAFSKTAYFDRSFPYRFILYLLNEVNSAQPEYYNHFLYVPDENPKHRIEEDEHREIKISIPAALFIECFFSFCIKMLPTSVKWMKERGLLLSIYKHHYIQFGDWIRVEHSWQNGIRWELGKLPNGHLDVVETSENSGTSGYLIFTRAVARSIFSEENPYLIIRNNCEHLGTYCFYGTPRSRQVRYGLFILVTLCLLPVETKLKFYLLCGLLSISLAFDMTAFVFYAKRNLDEDSTRFLNLMKIFARTFGKFPR